MDDFSQHTPWDEDEEEREIANLRDMIGDGGTLDCFNDPNPSTHTDGPPEHPNCRCGKDADCIEPDGPPWPVNSDEIEDMWDRLQADPSDVTWYVPEDPLGLGPKFSELKPQCVPGGLMHQNKILDELNAAVEKVGDDVDMISVAYYDIVSDLQGGIQLLPKRVVVDMRRCERCPCCHSTCEAITWGQ